MRIININPEIYLFNVRSPSNNMYIKTLCLECLSTKKTNSPLELFTLNDTGTNIHICSQCGAMTIQAIIAAFNISCKQVIKLIERKQIFEHSDYPEPIRFDLKPQYLFKLKEICKHG